MVLILKKILYIFLLLVLTLSIVACGKKEEQQNEVESDDEVGFYETQAVLDKDDGWVYYFALSRDKSGKITYYDFNGLNLIYKSLDGYYIPVYNEAGKEVSQVKPTALFLNYDQKHRKEYERISDYFNEKKFSSEITMDDLKDLKTDYYKKEDILYLFNEAVKQDYVRPMGDAIQDGFYESNVVNNSYWQFAILGCYGYADRIRIDYISNGVSLRESVEKNKKYDKEMYNTILEIENSILKDGMHKTFERFDDLDDVYAPLFSGLRQYASKEG